MFGVLLHKTNNLIDVNDRACNSIINKDAATITELELAYDNIVYQYNGVLQQYEQQLEICKVSIKACYDYKL